MRQRVSSSRPASVWPSNIALLLGDAGGLRIPRLETTPLCWGLGKGGSGFRRIRSSTGDISQATERVKAVRLVLSWLKRSYRLIVFELGIT